MGFDTKNIKGVDKLLAVFHDRRRVGGSAEATVRFRAKYALFVHEKIEMKLQGQPRPSGRGRYWDPQGKATARFLSKAVKELQPQLQKTIATTLKRGHTLWQALTLHATRVMKLAQRYTPVETGKLKASAYVTTRKK